MKAKKLIRWRLMSQLMTIKFIKIKYMSKKMQCQLFHKTQIFVSKRKLYQISLKLITHLTLDQFKKLKYSIHQPISDKTISIKRMD
jgi:hypothetical protein